MKKLLLAVSIVGILGGSAAADLVFDDFNVTEGHYGYAPSFSGSNLNVNAASTADRNITIGAAREGIGFERITIVPTTTGSASRMRFVSGGPPYTSANAATPAGNVGFSFTTSAAGTDGWIGFWLRTSISGWTAQLALDGPLPDLQGGVPKTISADGQWHLYEWNLDNSTDWGAVASIGGNATFEQGTQTIDSLVFRHTAAPSSSVIDLDFVALNSDGSVALITPAAVPEAGAFAAMGLVAFISAGAVWFKKRRAGHAAA